MAVKMAVVELTALKLVVEWLAVGLTVEKLMARVVGMHL